MCSNCPINRFGLGLLVLLGLTISSFAADSANDPATDAPRRVLRVAADPNNLPFTNQRGEGFENRIAELVARELDVDLEYVWRAQRRGFFRESLKEKQADLVLGVPVEFEMAMTTRPYYRSTYVFVTRRDRQLRIASLDDPRLQTLKIGVQLVGDDGTNPPAAHALARRGIIDNVVGFTVYGDYTEENPPARIVDAIADGTLDAAIVWGPLAGYMASQKSDPLDLMPVHPEVDPPALRFQFDIGMGVSHGNRQLRDELNEVIATRQKEIDAILSSFGIPTVARKAPSTESATQ